MAFAVPGRGFRTRVVVALVGVLTMAMAACTSGPSPTGPAPTDAPAHTLTIGATLEPPTLDPTANAAAAISQALLYNVYETLVKIDGEANIKPLLAQTWDLSDDRLTYTFKLNPAAVFADGTRVTAQVVADNVARVQTAAAPDKVALVVAQIASTNVVDDTTITMTLKAPSNRWLYEMAGAPGIIMNPAGFDTAGTEPAGSGPLALERWTQGDSIVLKKNTAYWGTPVRFDTVTFRYYKDANAMNSAMLADQLDIISNLQAPEMLTQFSDTSRFNIIEGLTDGEVTLAINNGGEHSSADDPDPAKQVPKNPGNPALADVRVRRALTMAIDRQALLDTVWGGKGTLIGSMVVQTDPFYEDLSGLNPYNPDEARRLLAEAGHSNLTLRLRPPTVPYASKSAQFVQSQLQAVGVTVTVEELGFPQWIQEVIGGADYDLSIVAHVEPRDIFTFGNPDYYWRYDNPEVTALLAAADAGTTEEYIADTKQAARIVAEDAAAIWLFTLPNLVVTRHGITGVPQNANSSLSFDVTTIARA